MTELSARSLGAEMRKSDLIYCKTMHLLGSVQGSGDQSGATFTESLTRQDVRAAAGAVLFASSLPTCHTSKLLNREEFTAGEEEEFLNRLLAGADVPSYSLLLYPFHKKEMAKTLYLLGVVDAWDCSVLYHCSVLRECSNSLTSTHR